jgi:hypothetical protein
VSNPRPGPLCIAIQGERYPWKTWPCRNMQPHYRGSSSAPGQAQPKRSFRLALWTHQHISQRENSQPHSLWCGKRHRQREETDSTGTLLGRGHPEDGGRAPVPADSRGARPRTRAIRRRPLAATNSTVSRPLQRPSGSAAHRLQLFCSDASDSAHSLQAVSLEGLRRLSS